MVELSAVALGTLLGYIVDLLLVLLICGVVAAVIMIEIYWQERKK